MKGYCLKCGKMRTMKSGKKHKYKKRILYKGKCDKCGTKIAKFI